jgi:hypothetical protein
MIPPKRYTCPFCLKQLANVYDLINHISLNHQRVKIFNPSRRDS